MTFDLAMSTPDEIFKEYYVHFRIWGLILAITMDKSQKPSLHD